MVLRSLMQYAEVTIKVDHGSGYHDMKRAKCERQARHEGNQQTLISNFIGSLGVPKNNA